MRPTRLPVIGFLHRRGLLFPMVLVPVVAAAADRAATLLLQLRRGERARLVAVAPPADPRAAAAGAGREPG